MTFAEVSAKTRQNLDKSMDDFILGIAGRRKVASLKDIHMNFLLSLSEDFDDDLLLDAILLLDRESE